MNGNERETLGSVNLVSINTVYILIEFNCRAVEFNNTFLTFFYKSERIKDVESKSK